MDELEQIKKALKKKRSSRSIHDSDLLSTGSTLLNLACSGRIKGGFAKGKFFYLVGDSRSGKTFLSLTCLAEANINPEFDDYRFIYDNVEDGALMDFTRYFGKGVALRVEPPRGTRKEPIYSETVEDFFFSLDDACKDERPFIYILDSLDAVSSDEETDTFDANKKAAREDKESKGSYGTAKAKVSSAGFRILLHGVRKTKSILIIISQTRDRIGFGFKKNTRSGGRALTFYSTIEMWSTVREKIKKKIGPKERQIGIVSHIQIEKNRITGKESDVLVSIYHSHGIDDVGSCIDYLLEEGYWKKVKGSIKVPEWEVALGYDTLICYIEENELELELQSIVAEVWNSIQEKSSPKRKNRYG